MTDRKPYSRVYWTVMEDEKFDGIREDVRHFGSWSLMLVVADMAYPAPAFIPPTVPRASLNALVAAELVDRLSGGRYRVRGLAKERTERAAAATRPGPPRTPSGTRTGPGRDPDGLQAKDEQSKDETRSRRDEQNAREVGPSDEETDVLARIGRAGAFIRPESGFGQRIIGLIARRGAEAVMAEVIRLEELSPLSDRQWVFGLERALEDIPDAPTPELPEQPSHGDRIYERMVARRIERFQQTGEWPEEWGERPGAAA